MTLKHFREVLQYVPNFRRETFVVAVDGDVVEDPNFANLVLDVGVLRSLSINVVLIHGIGAQLHRRAKQARSEISSDDESGITDDTTMDLVLASSADCAQKILGLFSSCSLPAVIPNSVIARPAGIISGVDLQNTGKVLKTETATILALLNEQLIPVLSPIGFDRSGHPLRISSDTLAVNLAIALNAKKIIFATTFDGIVSQGSFVRQMTFQQADQILKEQHNQLSSIELSKLRSAYDACVKGIERVHIINGTSEEGLLAEVFSTEGIGTLVHADNYHVIRAATKNDVGFIHSLVHDASNDDEVIARTPDEIAELICDHFIAEIDGNPVGCAAMHVYQACNTAEFASFVVSEGHRDFGLGTRLIQHVESKAKELGVRQLFCLSTQAFTYFTQRAGFVDGQPEDLPEQRRRRWANNGRNSKILIKALT